MSEEIKLKREVEAVAIPAGTTKKLPAGTEVIITQDLGGTFTVHTPHEGGLFRIQGKDADALGKKVFTETQSTRGAAGEDAVWAVLKNSKCVNGSLTKTNGPKLNTVRDYNRAITG